MFSRNLHRLRHTLAFRLTLWYAVIFSISFVLVFILFYLFTFAEIERKIDEELITELREYTLVLEKNGMREVAREVNTDSEAEGVSSVFYRILDPSGNVLLSSDLSAWKGLSLNRELFEKTVSSGEHVIETRWIRGLEHKSRILYGRIGPETYVQAGLSFGPNEQFASIFLKLSGIITVGIIFLAAVVGLFMARRALRGVEEVTETAQAIAGGALERRVSLEDRGDEVERLAATFNLMVDRIHALIRETREMNDNIAHDLRSPITRIRGTAEVTLTTGRSLSAYEAMGAGTIEECDKLLAMINTMLYISETESGAVTFEKHEVDMAGLVSEACELFMPVAEEKGIDLTCNAPLPCPVDGNITMLQRMVSNFLDNALKYTPENGKVSVGANLNGHSAILNFEDTGVGIDKENLSHIFKRFYREEKSRTGSGAGLGLALVKAIIKAHEGKVRVHSVRGEGSCFTVTLPLHSNEG